MILISFIKVLFTLPLQLNRDCVELPGADCLNNGWNNAHQVVQCKGIYYMGSFTGGRRISKTFWCPSGKQMRLSFTIAKFDSWDNESVFVYKDNALIENISYGPFDGTYMCLLSYYPDLIEKKQYQFVLPNGQNYVKFELVDNLQADNEESWGIRDITLEVVDPCVDFYSECNFQGDLWKICSGNQTTFAKFVPFKIKSIFILDGITVQMRDSKYHGGILQTYNSNQTCLDDFHFPKYEKSP